jgi:PAT family beta-lactamase induction signal transducer AmpG
MLSFKRSPETLRLFYSKRMLLMILLGFSSGLPFALVTQTLQAWFTKEGASLMALGWLGMLAQPYTFKVIWAPLLDRISLPWFGRRRGWMLVLQVILLVLLALMAIFKPTVSPIPLVILAFLVAFVSATQDVVIDAYRTEFLQPTERGFGTAVFIGGYRISLLISGGLALILASRLGWQVTYFLMALAMGVGICATLMASEEKVVTDNRSLDWRHTFIDPLRELWDRKMMGVFLIFIVLYKMDVNLVNAMLMPFLLREVGFDLATVGFATQVLGITGTMVGVFLGGILLSRFNLLPLLFTFGLLQAFATLFFAMLDIIGQSKPLLYGILLFENFCAGLGTSALIAFMMGLCHRRFTATQFALLSALANFGRVALSPVASFLIVQIGWTQFYIWAFIIALPALALLWFKRVEFRNPIEVAV